MKRLVGALLLCASTAFGQWDEVANGWSEIQNAPVPLTSPSTGTLDIRPGSLIANNLTATALATPTVTSVTPTLTKIGSITTIGGGAKATGDITAPAAADLGDGETFTLSDGSGTVVFEFDNAGDGVGGGNAPILIAALNTAGEVASAINDAILTEYASLANITTNYTPGDATVYIIALDIGTSINVPITTTVATPNFILNGLSGGLDGLRDGDYFTIKYDTGLTVPIEFDAAPGNGTSGGRIPYVFAPGDTATVVRDGLIALLNAAAPTALTASSGGVATVSLVLDTPGAVGDTNTENVLDAGFAVTGFANPTAATTYGYKAVSYLADGTSTAASTEVTTAAGHATLSASNFNTVVFAPSPGSTSTRLYRTTGGTAPPKLLYTGTATSYVDTGAAGTAETPATANGTGRVLVGNGDLTKPSFSFVSAPTTGFALSAGNIQFALGGVLAWQYTTAQLWNNNNLSNIVFGAAADTIISRGGAAATLQLGAANAASPVAQTLQAQGSSGTDIPGATLTIRPGAGTGAAAVSSLLLQTPAVTTSGSTAQTQTTRMTLSESGVTIHRNVYPDGSDLRLLGQATLAYRSFYLSRATLGSKSKAITDGSATAFATFTIADGATYTGEIIYKVKAVKATALQALAGRARFAATREGSTYTVSISEVGTQTLAAAAGTLTGSISIAGTGGVVTLSANFDTSQASPDTFTIDARFDSPDAALALTFP